MSVQTEKPDVNVTQPPPQVIVKNPEPNVQVQTGQPDVKVLPAEKPNVTVNQTPDKPDVNVGTTAAPDTPTPGAGAAAVAPAAGTYPVATDVEKFIGKDVYGANGQKVGELDNVLISPTVAYGLALSSSAVFSASARTRLPCLGTSSRLRTIGSWPI